MIEYGEMDNPHTYVPDHIRPAITRWIEDGLHPGGFLMSVICNDLMLASLRADINNKASLASIAAWFWYYAPCDCHGVKAQSWKGIKES